MWQGEKKMSYVTQAPLPRLFDLLSVPFMRTPKEEVLSLAWTQPGDIAYWFSRSAWSMVVVARWRQYFAKVSVITIWVPEYFCNESLTLLRRMGANIVFYPIDVCGHPVFDQFKMVTEDNWPDLFLLVHYFGQPTPFVDALDFCKRYGAWLVEDAAHVLKPTIGVGVAGDFVLYSPHKHLAIQDGAILVVSKLGASALLENTDDLNVLAKIVNDLDGDKRRLDWAIVIWLIKRVLQKMGVRAWHRRSAFIQDQDVVGVGSIDDPVGMGVVSKRLLKRDVVRLTEHAAHRMHCLAEWSRVIRGILPTNIGEIQPSSESPYLACLRAIDKETAESLYSNLTQMGGAVSTWPDLPPEVSTNAEYVTGPHLKNTRIYMPVHQSVTKKKIVNNGNRLRRIHLLGWRLQLIHSKTDWDSLWGSCSRKSLPQTWEYGSAKAVAEGWDVQRFVVFDSKEKPTALFQVLLKSFCGLGCVARINRGPLILRDEVHTDDHLVLNTLAVLMRESKKRRWWMVQIAPLLSPGIVAESCLRDMGFRKQPICPMDSALLSLKNDSENLLMSFNGKWRNCLRKGLKKNVTVKFDTGGAEYFSWLIKFYRTQQREKQFEGTSDQMLRALAFQQSHLFKFNLFLALDGTTVNEKSLLGVLVTLHFGDVSEYLIGITNERGRAYQANSVLLWEAILHAKQNGCRWFDVGGLSENTPKGIADFKRGLNPESYALVGEWRKWF